MVPPWVPDVPAQVRPNPPQEEVPLGDIEKGGQGSGSMPSADAVSIPKFLFRLHRPLNS